MNRSLSARLLAETPVVITGYGVATAAGSTVAELWQRALYGPPPAVRREYKIGARLREFSVCAAPDREANHPRVHRFGSMDRSLQLAWVAATQARAMAELDPADPAEDVGLALGSSRGPLGAIQEGFARAGHRRYPPRLATDSTLAAVSGALTQALGLHGPCLTLSATCASAAFAIGLAAEQILLGKANAMLAGGAEAPLVSALLAQFDAAGVLGSHDDPARTCRPFDITRNGLCLGEGSAFLVLESAASAARRGAVPRARLSGWAMCLDHSGRTGINRAGTTRLAAVHQALELAGLAAQDLDCINAHGNGTRLSDAAEAQGLSTLLGPRRSIVPCISTKPVTGHCLGATPALEAVLCLESIRNQTVPPTFNCTQLDPDCPIDPQPSGPRLIPLRHVLSHSLGFWGYHAALIFSPP